SLLAPPDPRPSALEALVPNVCYRACDSPTCEMKRSAIQYNISRDRIVVSSNPRSTAYGSDHSSEGPVLWLRHMFADSVYNGRNRARPWPNLGYWTIEILTRTTESTGFQLLPRRWVVEPTLTWFNRNRRPGKGLRDLTHPRRKLDLKG